MSAEGGAGLPVAGASNAAALFNEAAGSSGSAGYSLQGALDAAAGAAGVLPLLYRSEPAQSFNAVSRVLGAPAPRHTGLTYQMKPLLFTAYMYSDSDIQRLFGSQPGLEFYKRVLSVTPSSNYCVGCWRFPTCRHAPTCLRAARTVSCAICCRCWSTGIEPSHVSSRGSAQPQQAREIAPRDMSAGALTAPRNEAADRERFHQLYAGNLWLISGLVKFVDVINFDDGLYALRELLPTGRFDPKRVVFVRQVAASILGGTSTVSILVCSCQGELAQTWVINASDFVSGCTTRDQVQSALESIVPATNVRCSHASALALALLKKGFIPVRATTILSPTGTSFMQIGRLGGPTGNLFPFCTATRRSGVLRLKQKAVPAGGTTAPSFSCTLCAGYKRCGHREAGFSFMRSMTQVASLPEGVHEAENVMFGAGDYFPIGPAPSDADWRQIEAQRMGKLRHLNRLSLPSDMKGLPRKIKEKLAQGCLRLSEVPATIDAYPKVSSIATF